MQAMQAKRTLTFDYSALFDESGAPRDEHVYGALYHVVMGHVRVNLITDGDRERKALLFEHHDMQYRACCLRLQREALTPQHQDFYAAVETHAPLSAFVHVVLSAERPVSDVKALLSEVAWLP